MVELHLNYFHQKFISPPCLSTLGTGGWRMVIVFHEGYLPKALSFGSFSRKLISWKTCKNSGKISNFRFHFCWCFHVSNKLHVSAYTQFHSAQPLKKHQTPATLRHLWVVETRPSSLSSAGVVDNHNPQPNNQRPSPINFLVVNNQQPTLKKQPMTIFIIYNMLLTLKQSWNSIYSTCKRIVLLQSFEHKLSKKLPCIVYLITY